MALLWAVLPANAQENYSPLQDQEFVFHFHNASVFLLGAYIVSRFILSLIKSILDYRLKSRMIERGVSEVLAKQFVGSQKADLKNRAFKWFAILSGIGTGLIIIYSTQPVGLHSLAIMAFCVAIGFLAYYFFEKNQELPSNE